MDIKAIQKNVAQIKQAIEKLEHNLSSYRNELAHAETQLAEAIAAESKKLELVNGDYGKLPISKWVFAGGTIYWEDGASSEIHAVDLLDSRKGNIFREMEERQE